ncbi:MAG: toll/interleukin-1 receptor domain-containing protein [Bacteroidia bacterium]|nr:toll/interleukin-1 receptor domain-containing protein [Bacteroidia bacterium]
MEDGYKITELRITTTLEEFRSKCALLIKDANELQIKGVLNDDDYTVLETSALQWYENTSKLLKTSFNEANNHVEHQFYLECYGGSRPLTAMTKVHLTERIKAKREWLKNGATWLEDKVSILSVCDSIVNYSEDVVKEIKNLDTEGLLLFILRKLYQLPRNGYYSLKEILEGNGLKNDIKQTHDLGIILYKSGYIDFVSGDFAALKIEGRIWLENSEKKTKTKNPNESEKKVKKKIFISHSTDDRDITSKFCDLILGNVFNIPRRDIFNTSHEGSKPKTGEDFKKRIKVELEEAKIIFQFISKSYKASEVCLIEMGAAWVLCDNVIPLIVEEGEYDVGFIHSTTQQAHLHVTKDIIKTISDLVDTGMLPHVRLDVLSEKVNEFVESIGEHNGLGKISRKDAVRVTKHFEKQVWSDKFKGPGSWIFNYWTKAQPNENEFNRVVGSNMFFKALAENIGSNEYGACIDIPGLISGGSYIVRCKVRASPGSTMAFQLWVHDGRTNKNAAKSPLTLKTPAANYYETVNLEFTVNETRAIRIHLHCKTGKGFIKVSEVVLLQITTTEVPNMAKNYAPTEADLEMIINYMDSKKFRKMSMEKVKENIHHKFTEDYILALIEKFPNDLTRAKVKGQIGIENLYPDFNGLRNI